MKNKKILLLAVLGLLLASIASGCTGAAGAASSWPGSVADGETGYFAFNSQIFAINLKNGNPVWTYPSNPDAKVQFYAAPTVTEDTVYAGSYANSLVAINKSSGVGKVLFDRATDRFVGSPLVVGDRIFAPNSDKFLYALNDSGDLLWKFKTNGPNWSQPLTDGENIYLASMDHFVYALKMDYPPDELGLDKNGSRTLVVEPLWERDLGTAVVSEPAWYQDNIIVATIDGDLHSVDAATGDINWTFPNEAGYRSVWGSLVVTDEAIYFGDEAGNIFAVSPDGNPLWATPYSAGASVISGGVLTDEGPLFVSEDGRVFLIGIDQNPRPIMTLDAVIHTPPEFSDGQVILAPATKDKLFMGIDLNGNQVWSYVPSK